MLIYIIVCAYHYIMKVLLFFRVIISFFKGWNTLWPPSARWCFKILSSWRWWPNNVYPVINVGCNDSDLVHCRKQLLTWPRGPGFFGIFLRLLIIVKCGRQDSEFATAVSLGFAGDGIIHKLSSSVGLDRPHVQALNSDYIFAPARMAYSALSCHKMKPFLPLVLENRLAARVEKCQSSTSWSQDNRTAFQTPVSWAPLGSKCSFSQDEVVREITNPESKAKHVRIFPVSGWGLSVVKYGKVLSSFLSIWGFLPVWHDMQWLDEDINSLDDTAVLTSGNHWKDGSPGSSSTVELQVSDNKEDKLRPNAVRATQPWMLGVFWNSFSKVVQSDRGEHFSFN